MFIFRSKVRSEVILQCYFCGLDLVFVLLDCTINFNRERVVGSLLTVLLVVNYSKFCCKLFVCCCSDELC